MLSQEPSGGIVRVTLVDPEGQLLGEINDPKMKRDDVAATYALALNDPTGSVDWRRVNQAIIDRWSIAALRYIKDKAWLIRR